MLRRHVQASAQLTSKSISNTYKTHDQFLFHYSPPEESTYNTHYVIRTILRIPDSSYHVAVLTWPTDVSMTQGYPFYPRGCLEESFG